MVDDRVHTSVGVVRPEKLLEQYYWVCQNCNYFTSSLKKTDYYVACPVCKAAASAPKPRLYKVPGAFTTDWRQNPKVTPYSKPMRQPTSQVFLAKEGDISVCLSSASDPYTLAYSQAGRFFLANQGPAQDGKGFKNPGFALCRFCGRDLSEEVRKQRTKVKGSKKTAKTSKSSESVPSTIPHNHPISDRPCPGGYERTHLGHDFLSDLLKLRFSQTIHPPILFEPVIHLTDGEEIASVEIGGLASQPTGMAFWRSLTSALLAAASQVIDVPRTELDGLFRPSEDRDGSAEIVIYDNVPGGAGYSRKIGERFREVLQQAYQIVESCSCGSSCYDCLRTYSNQFFHHELDRHQVKAFLQPLVEQVNPELFPELQDFAADANQVTHPQIMDQLGAYSRAASSTSIMSLSQLEEPFTLKRLTEIVNALQSRNEPLELIVHHLPHPVSVRERVLRKRLQQWIDQGALKLYLTDHDILPELCLSSQWERYRIALRYCPAQGDNAAYWLKTTTERGVIQVFDRLKQSQQQAKSVAAQDLIDRDTTVVFPDHTWKNLNIDQLRHQLGLEPILVGSKIIRVVYSDRYLNASNARLLADLLKGDWLASNTQVTIHIQQLYEEYRSNDTSRRADLEKVMTQQLSLQTNVKMRPYGRNYGTLSHSRELTIYHQDKKVHRVLFDKGMDFLKKTEGSYQVSESTYVVVTQ